VTDASPSPAMPIAPQDPKKPVASPARRHFHITLASCFLPVFSWPIVFMLISVDLAKSADSEDERRWAWRTLAVFAMDILIFVSFLIWHDKQHPANFGRWAPDTGGDSSLRMGVDTDPSDQPGRVRRLMSNGPAARAGLREGDVILEVDGSEVTSHEDIHRFLQGAVSGVARKVQYRRDGQTMETTVVPEVIRKPWNHGLLDTWGADEPYPWKESLLWLSPCIGIAAVGWIVARRRGAPRSPIWMVFLLVLVVSQVVAISVLLTAKTILGGYSGLGMLLSLTAHTLTILPLTVVGARFDRGRIPREPVAPLRSQLGVALRAIFYDLTAIVRIGVALSALAGFLSLDPAVFDPIRYLAGMRLGILGTILLVMDAVLLAPIAEEFLFRGFLLPRLSGQLGPAWALGLSSLAFASLHQYQGVFMIFVLFMALIVGWTRLRTGSLFVPIALHMLQNAWTTVRLMHE